MVAAGCGISQDDLAKLVARHFKLDVADLGSSEPAAAKLVPEKVARQFLVFPIREDDRRLVVATADPTNYEAEQMLGFASGRTPTFVVALPEPLESAINAQYAPDRSVESILRTVDSRRGRGVTILEEEGAEAVGAGEAGSAPVVKLTNAVFQEAVTHRAERHPLRARPERRRHPLPRGRGDGALHAPADAGPQPGRLAHQDPQQARHRRPYAAPGRPCAHPGPGEGVRPAGLDGADPRGGEGRHPHPRPAGGGRARRRRPAEAGGDGAAPPPRQPRRHRAHHGPDGFGEDDDALRRHQGAGGASHQHHDGRGPDRVRAEGDHAGAGRAQAQR